MINEFHKYGIIVFLFIFIFCCFLFHNNVYCADDLLYHFLERPIALIQDYYYGTWIMPFQNFTMYFLPHKLGINFQIWAMSFGTILKSLTISLMIYFFYKTFIQHQIKPLVSSLISLVSFMLLFCLYSKINFADFVLFSGFFRFVIPSCLLIIAFYFLNKLFWNENINLILLFFVSFFCAYSSEISAGILIPLTLFLMVYQYFYEDRKNLKPFSISLIALFIGTYCLVSSTGFHYHVSDKLGGYVVSYSAIIKLLPEFIKVFSKSLISDYALIWLFALFMILYNLKHNDGKYNIFSVSVLVSLIIFAFSLIVLGKTSYDGGFWVEHKDIYSVFIPVFLYSVSVLCIPLIKKTDKSLLFNSVFIVIFIVSSVFFFKFCLSLSNELSIIKQNVYLWDKIRLFYSYKSIQPVYPVPEQYSYLFVQSDAVYNMEKYYYPLNYKTNIDNNTNNTLFINYKEGLDTFEKNGGCYKEVLKGKYDFRNLEVKDFVLKGCSES